MWEFAQDGSWQGNLIWGLLLVMVAVDASRIERLARRHPDLYLSKRLRGEHLTTRARQR